MITAGIDIGSLTAKMVILNSGDILCQAIILTEPDSIRSAESILREGLTQSGLSKRDIKYIVATGYGRVNVPYAQEHITEISCHARGSQWLFPSVRTILDMGGQDCKAIRCDDSGRVIDYSMNDKCAAGTGRFLEIIAETLDVPLDQIGDLSLDAKNSVSISSVCAVFAKQEISSLMRKGVRKQDILSSLFESVTDRVLSLIERTGGVEPDFVITGGIAKNTGICEKIRKRQGNMNILKCPEPQIVGALGAALFARDRLTARS